MIKLDTISNNLIIISFIFFIFLWGFNAGNYLNFDIRLLIVLLLPLLFFRIYKDLKKKDCTILKILIFFSLFLITHYIVVSDLKTEELPKIILYIVAACYLLCSAYYFFDFLLNNKVNIIFFFYFFFFISLGLSIFVNLPVTEQFSCGAFKYLNLMKPIKEFFFFENSHFGMVSISILFTSLFYVIKKKTSILFKILFIIFLFTTVLKFSATLLISIIFTTFAFLFVERKRLGNVFFYILILINLFCSTIFLSDNTCKSKIIPKYNNDYYLKDQKIYDNLSKILNYSEGSLSSAVLFNAANVTYNSLKYKPFGWGFQNYESAFINYNKEFPQKNKLLLSLNSKDGGNNFFKLIVEFGIFGFFIYIFLIYSFFSKKITLENKLFLFPFIISQSIRGAGYFNGGFILILFIVLFLQFKKKQNVYSF
jgi:O-antigen ligase